MNLLIGAATIYTPAPIKRKGLVELFAATAAAFGCEAPRAGEVSYDEMLRSYALFTAAQAEQALDRDAALPEIRLRLYTGARRMGEDLRRAFRIANTHEALDAASMLYRALGIDLRARPHGDSCAEVQVHRCFFSEYYSGEICRLIASLDEGLFAGLSGGGQLSFYRRITEGATCCRAHFRA